MAKDINIMTLDEVIYQLEAYRNNYGGAVPVFITEGTMPNGLAALKSTMVVNASNPSESNPTAPRIDMDIVVLANFELPEGWNNRS